MYMLSVCVNLRQGGGSRRWWRRGGVALRVVYRTRSSLAVVVLVFWPLRRRGRAGLGWWGQIVSAILCCCCLFGGFYGNYGRRQAAGVWAHPLTFSLSSCHTDVLFNRLYIPICWMDVVHVSQKTIRLVECVAWNKKEILNMCVIIWNHQCHMNIISHSLTWASFHASCQGVEPEHHSDKYFVFTLSALYGAPDMTWGKIKI